MIFDLILDPVLTRRIILRNLDPKMCGKQSSFAKSINHLNPSRRLRTLNLVGPVHFPTNNGAKVFLMKAHIQDFTLFFLFSKLKIRECDSKNPFSSFFCMFLNPNIFFQFEIQFVLMFYIGLRNLKEQGEKAF